MAFIGQTTVATSTPDFILPNVPCEILVEVGHWVRMSSGIAIRALANQQSNSNVLGLVESKNSSTLANIRVLGVSAPIFVNLDETKEYLLSSTVAGEMTLIAPLNPGNIILKLGQPFDNQRFLVLKGSMIIRS